ncbi:MAG: polysialyltransferase family glycosyltransferase [Acidaminococcaceae bacterium]|uniref:polysialyltransferase family glycosyltransferase n=1 Tax=uncultured Phascolarctobacterium sp. TaxID=512296 RepID=UPI0026F9C7B8|nr:polysialyltransferase family glycosyltransferase [uncultured Phascolarctobacterium sp.]MDO5380652.1 polysialyltransferase family glycosyltransferase [Acidaminococcaceae bacterium]
MKILFICLTDFQILNALNLKANNFSERQADIFFVTNKEGNDKLAERLIKTGIFENVYLFDNAKIKGLHYFFRTLTENGKTGSFIEACLNSLREFLYKIKSLIYGHSYQINEKLVNKNNIDFKIYDEIFCLDKRKIVADLANIVLKASANKCKINLMDEGTSTYWRSILETRFPIDYIYLYQPELANYYVEDNWKERIKTIPAIDWRDQEFRNLINTVFSFSFNENGDKKSTEELIEFANKIIFFDQNWDPMPKYFDRLPLFLRLLLHNPYKKHKKESRFYDAKMDMFRIVANNSSGNDVVVKLHPRSPDEFAEDYLVSKCTMSENLKIPWEVFMDNCSFKNNIWVTVSSTALCTYKMAFKNRLEDVPMIFLYKIVYKDKMDFQEDDEFFRGFQNKYPQSVFLPETVEEFKRIYEKLIVEMNSKKA